MEDVLGLTRWRSYVDSAIGSVAGANSEDARDPRKVLRAYPHGGPDRGRRAAGLELHDRRATGPVPVRELGRGATAPLWRALLRLLWRKARAGGAVVTLPSYLTPKQVADMLQVDERTVLRWAQQDAYMPATRIGRVIRFEKTALERWLARKRPRSAQGSTQTAVAAP